MGMQLLESFVKVGFVRCKMSRNKAKISIESTYGKEIERTYNDVIGVHLKVNDTYVGAMRGEFWTVCIDYTIRIYRSGEWLMLHLITE